MRSGAGRRARRGATLAMVLVVTGAFGASQAQALTDTFDGYGSAGTRIQTTNGFHTYMGLYVGWLTAGPWPDTVCVKGFTRDNAIRNGTNPCATSSGGANNLSNYNCIPTGDPVTIAYGYYTGPSGINHIAGRAQTGACF
jgi:hypothetical protein